jgi:hypothetical protein
MTLPAGGAISLNQVNVELQAPATTTISLNDSGVRYLAQIYGSGTQISMSSLFGTSRAFGFSFSGGTRLNLRDLAIAYGWNQTAELFAYNVGVINSDLDGYYALVVNGSFPRGVQLINYSLIAGKGGNGGSGAGPDGGSSGSAGAGGNPAILIESPISINNVSWIAGGGGGGGGGQSGVFQISYPDYPPYERRFGAAGGGGGGGGGNTGGSGGGTGGSFSYIDGRSLDGALYDIGLWNDINLAYSAAYEAYGGADGAVLSQPGAGGNPGSGGRAGALYYRRDTAATKDTPAYNTYYGCIGGNGGSGGYYGSAGDTGGYYQMGNISFGSSPGGGGAAGIAVQGNSVVTWLTYGAIYGGRVG